MISLYNSITGTVSRKILTNQLSQLCLVNQGIEYIFEASRGALMNLPEPGQEARVFVYTIHREDAFYLCGFASEAERAMFLELIKVEGIGPKQALKILGAITHSSLEQLLEAGDLTALESLPGVGKKTAQKMVLTLKGKLNIESIDGARPAAASRSDLGDLEDLAQALVAMGYERKLVAESLKRLAPECQDLPKAQREQELMRRAIIALS